MRNTQTRAKLRGKERESESVLPDLAGIGRKPKDPFHQWASFVSIICSHGYFPLPSCYLHFFRDIIEWALRGKENGGATPESEKIQFWTEVPPLISCFFLHCSWLTIWHETRCDHCNGSVISCFLDFHWRFCLLLEPPHLSMNFGGFSYFEKRGEGKRKELVVKRWRLKMERSRVKVEYVLPSGSVQVVGCGCPVCPQCSCPCSGNSPSLATTEYCSLFFYSACQNAMTTGWFYANRAWLSRDSVSESQTWMAAIGMQRSQKPDCFLVGWTA